MTKYFVTGWSPRFGHWMTATYECLSMEKAKGRFIAEHPTLKQIKVYAMRDV